MIYYVLFWKQVLTVAILAQDIGYYTWLNLAFIRCLMHSYEHQQFEELLSWNNGV